MHADTVYRVTVRGRFDDLNEKTREYLAREQAEHDIFKSAYSPEGTFTYDERILFFNFRYEIRTSNGAEEAGATGLNEAESFLRTLGYGFKGLKVSIVDASGVWTSD